MSIFIPYSHARPRRTPPAWCTYCAKTNLASHYDLIDGPIRWQFCDEACADAWVEYRHKHIDIATCLKLVPGERQAWLAERGFESTQQLISSLLSDNEALPASGDTPAGLRDVHSSQVSM